MKVYGTHDLRNLSVVGHGDAGKTSLIAAMIFATGASSRLGRVDDGTAPAGSWLLFGHVGSKRNTSHLSVSGLYHELNSFRKIHCVHL